jgi:3-hydroxyacyl-[acyl-carrier-protein] dehydratase
MEITLPLKINEIKEYLPHRYPMLLVDRVIEYTEGERIVGIKNVTANEGFFEGHFPGRPIMPGVLMLEALAQLGVLFFKMASNGVGQDKLIVFAAADEVKFRREVVPGDVLTLQMDLIKRRSGIWKMAGLATVDGEKAVEGILTAAEGAPLRK